MEKKRFQGTLAVLRNDKALLFSLHAPHQNTALHLAAREGHAAAVRLLLRRGAQMLLNNSDASFLHEAVHNYRKEATVVVLESSRQVHRLIHINTL